MVKQKSYHGLHPWLINIETLQVWETMKSVPWVWGHGKLNRNPAGLG